MKIIDNDPIDKPCIGELIEEQCAVGQFADNCLYLIADPEADIAKRAVGIMEQFKQIADCDDYYNTYELEVVQNVELKNHPKIKERIEQHGDNFLIQLASRGFNEKKRFIVAKTDNDKLFENINLMIYAAERIAKFDIAALLRSFVEDNTDEFVELARNVSSSTISLRYQRIQSIRPLGWHLPPPSSRNRWRLRVSSPINNAWKCMTGYWTT